MGQSGVSGGGGRRTTNGLMKTVENNNSLWESQLSNPAADLINKVINRAESSNLGSTILSYN